MTVASQLSEYLGLRGDDTSGVFSGSVSPALTPPNSGKNAFEYCGNTREAVVRCGEIVPCGRRPHPLLGLKPSTSSLGS